MAEGAWRNNATAALNSGSNVGTAPLGGLDPGTTGASSAPNLGSLDRYCLVIPFPFSDRDVSLFGVCAASWDRVGVELTDEHVAQLWAVTTSRDVSGAVATRARIVLWTAEVRMRKDVGKLAEVSLPTVDRRSTGTLSVVWPAWGSISVALRPSRCRPGSERGSWR